MSRVQKQTRSFGSKTIALESAILSLETAMADYEELVMIRARIVNDQMTDDLYKFVDAHQALRGLFHGLPAKAELESSCEALKVSQIYYADVAIEGLLENIKKIIIDIWNKFCDWIMNWVDDNRRLKFRLIRHQRRLKAEPLKYGGTRDNYNKIQGVCYNYEKEWKKMYEAVVTLNQLLKTVPGNKPAEWFSNNFNKLKKCLQEFGYELHEQGTSYSGVITESIRPYSPLKRAIGEGGAGWSQNQLIVRVGECIKLIEVDEDARKSFKEIKRVFDSTLGSTADIIDIAALKRLVRICKLSKEFAGGVARAVHNVCNIALNAG